MENFCCDFDHGNFLVMILVVENFLVMILSMENFFGHVILVVDFFFFFVEHGKFCGVDFGCGNIFVGYVNYGMVNFCWLWVYIFVGMISFFFLVWVGIFDILTMD